MGWMGSIKNIVAIGTRRLRQTVVPVIIALVLSFAQFETFVADATGGVQQVSTGATTACAVTDGKVKCWGDNTYGQLGNGTKTKSLVPVAVSGGALANKYVERVSAGETHTCALANARVYCWGDNGHGQLGNRTNSNSIVPVVVDTQSKDSVATSVTGPSGCGNGWGQTRCKTTTTPARPKSALANKEVVDIASAEYFTCALASDGTVACWGEGDNGRLGTNSTADVNYPKSVYAAGALNGKRGIKLAKAAGATMCLTAIDMKPSIASTGSKPYCWGYGVGTGLIPAATYTKCSRSVGSTYKTVSTTTTVYFDSLQPVDSAGVISNLIGIDIANTNQISGLGTNERAYYWGLHGYTKTVASTGKQTGTGCTYRVEDTEKNGKHDHPKTHPNCGGGKPGCSGGGAKKYKTVYRYDLRTTYVRIGSVTALGPLYNGTAATGPLNQRTLTAASGNAYDGLFCAAIDSATYCDAHGTSMSEGQTGSNYAQPCTTTGSIFKTTTCSSAPTGPQQVTATGWLAGKTISSLETGSSGYTCAIASGSVGCWGVNNSGQLGTGDKTNRKVPTAVSNL